MHRTVNVWDAFAVALKLFKHICWKCSKNGKVPCCCFLRHTFNEFWHVFYLQEFTCDFKIFIEFKLKATQTTCLQIVQIK